MQYLAATIASETLYFGAHAPPRITKELEYAADGDGGDDDDSSVRLLVRTYPGMFGEGSYSSSFAMVTAVFPGDWQTAAHRYRTWIEDGGIVFPPKLVDRKTDWLNDSPSIVNYSVTGQGHYAGPTAPNGLLPYVNALPALERLASETQSSLMLLLMHWEGTAP